jgi:hypothetical protein
MLLYHRAPFLPEIKAPQAAPFAPSSAAHSSWPLLPFWSAAAVCLHWADGMPQSPCAVSFGISKIQLSSRYCCAVTGPVLFPWGLVWGSGSCGVALSRPCAVTLLCPATPSTLTTPPPSLTPPLHLVSTLPSLHPSIPPPAPSILTHSHTSLRALAPQMGAREWGSLVCGHFGGLLSILLLIP